MSRYKNFLPWLFSADKKPLYVENGNVLEGDRDTLLKPDGQPAHLPDSPTGWRDTLVKYGRNTKYLGLFRDFTVPLKFGLDAAKIIKKAMWAKGIEAVMYFGLHKFDRYNLPYSYKPWYVGELDFSKFKQNKDSVDINVLEGGMAKYLKAFEATQYEIPITDDPQAVNVYMDGMEFSNKIEYTIYDQPGTTATEVNVGMGIIVQEGSTQGIINYDQEYIAGPAGFPNEQQFMKSFSKTFTATINGSISILRQTAGSHGVRIRFRKRNDLTSTTTDYIIFQGFTNPGNYTYNYSFSIPMAPNDKLYLKYDAYTDSLMTFRGTGGGFTINYDIKFDPTFCKALRPAYLFNKIVQKMSNGACYGSSNFLNNLNTLVFTSGNAIRGLSGASIKISLDDFYKALKPYLTGLGIKNEQLVLESLNDFFLQNTIIDLGVVDNVEVDVAEDLIYNTIKVGYRNNTYDNVNGKDEFNVTQQYTTTITKVVKELDLVSPVRADAYGIELTRLNLTGKTTTDNSADNESFMLSINNVRETISGTPAYRLLRPAYDDITGVLHPNSVFNVELSPKRRLNSYLPYINSMLDLQGGSLVTFQTGEKNSDLATSIGGVIVEEKSNITINPNGPKLFKPYYFTFSTEVPFEYLAIMNSNPYGKIAFTYQGNTYTGYMWDGGIKPATNDRQSWKLLACADNDMTKLI